MAISFECERCGRSYQVADELAGKRGRCTQCGHIFRVPADYGPRATDLYELEIDEPPGQPPDDESFRPVKQKKKKASALFGLSALPAWGLTVYRCVILALLVISLLVGGLAKLIIAMIGAFLAVGPFVAMGFRYRYGVAFRDGPIAGVLYMLFVPYRIHYRLTHQELFRNLRAPTLKLRDYSLLVLGVLFLPVIILAAQDMDKRAKNPPPAVDWAHFGPRFGNVGMHPVPPRQRPAWPNLPGPPRGIGRRRGPTGPPTANIVPTEPKTPEPVPVEQAPEQALAEKAPAGPTLSRPGEAESGSVAGRRAFGGPGMGGPLRSGHRDRRPPMPGPPGGSAPPAYGPDVTVTITVSGVADFEASRQMNAAITEILKASGDSWSLRSNTGGGKATFTAAPVPDPKAFADKIDFGKVTRIEGRSIDVEAGP